MKKILIALLVIVLLGGGYYVMNSKKSQESSDNMMPTPSSSEAEKTTMPANAAGTPNSQVMMEKGVVKEFTLVASEFAFDVKTMTVKKGDTVKVTLANSGKMPHDWVVDEYNVKTKQIKNGETDTVTFVADKTGTFEYYCSVGKHRAMGMVGKLMVE